MAKLLVSVIVDTMPDMTNRLRAGGNEMARFIQAETCFSAFSLQTRYIWDRGSQLGSQLLRVSLRILQNRLRLRKNAPFQTLVRATG